MAGNRSPLVGWRRSESSPTLRPADEVVEAGVMPKVLRQVRNSLLAQRAAPRLPAGVCTTRHAVKTAARQATDAAFDGKEWVHQLVPTLK